MGRERRTRAPLGAKPSEAKAPTRPHSLPELAIRGKGRGHLWTRTETGPSADDYVGDRWGAGSRPSDAFLTNAPILI